MVSRSQASLGAWPWQLEDPRLRHNYRGGSLGCLAPLPRRVLALTRSHPSCSFRVIHECVTLLLAMPWEDRKLVEVQQPDMLSRLSVSATVSRLLRHFKELNVAETHQALAEDVQALYHDVMDSARSGE